MFFDDFSGDQLRVAYARNAAGLATMLDKAERTGRKVGGFTADYLRAKVAEYRRLSVASDDDVRAHLQVRRP